jgi:PGF-pre-PGF domain-containing protein
MYRAFNIRVVDGNPDKIENANMNFKVEKSWIQHNNIDRTFIILNQYDDRAGKWIKMPIHIDSEDGQFVYLATDVSGYSSFAIT